MNWVLILVLHWSGTSSQQIGPYASSADCERAYAVIESQAPQQSRNSIKEHYCVPRPHTSNSNAIWELPKEFD